MGTSPSEVDLAAITFCHRRAGRLRDAIQQFLEQVPIRTGLSTRLVLMPDRTTAAVWDVVEDWRDHPHVVVKHPSLPIMSPQRGQQWTRARNEGLDAIDECWRPRWVMNLDDDWQLGPGWEVLPELLAQDDVMAWRAVSLFLWDADNNVNVRQRHYSPLIGRHQPGWRRDPAMTNQIAVEAEQGVHRDLPFYLLDYGTTDDAERTRLFRDYANAGKMDDYTARYVAPPLLQPLDLVLATFPVPTDFWKWQLQNVG